MPDWPAPPHSHFNPRSSCEERLEGSLWLVELVLFQSTLLMRGATYALTVQAPGEQISIHAPHARSDLQREVVLRVKLVISIHAPHARSDGLSRLGAHRRRISIHAPHARSDIKRETGLELDKFQSTLLMRGATISDSTAARQLDISIHAPHARSDCHKRHTAAIYFLISIHAPHARSDDLRADTHIQAYRDFNPRSSCEERRPLHGAH